jgi:quinone-modifying oxidoreductase subunit QmoA
MKSDPKPILVLGGGIAGMTAAVEAAEVGYPVILVEQEPFLGGRVIRSHKYFPKMCPPACGFEINARRIRDNEKITVHTLSTVEEITGSVGRFRATIRKKPRYVTGEVSLDETVEEAITSERPDDFNMGVGTTKALYYPHDAAFPALHVLDREALSDSDAAILTEAAPPGSIDLDMEEETLEVDAGAIIVATGWKPYDATKLDNLGVGSSENVVTNVMFERLAAPTGPTGGKILRPSDGEPAKNVAFVQCAGSRDENHLPYCSAICCMASMKQVRYLKEANEGAHSTIFYIDIRTLGRLEDFYYDLVDDDDVTFVKGKVAQVAEENGTGNLRLEVEDTVAGERPEEVFDMVVLATGIVPNNADVPLPFQVEADEYGFLDGGTDVEGVFAAGCAKNPCDVSRTTKDATAAALKAIQCLRKG